MSSPFGSARFPYPSPSRQANHYKTLARQSPGLNMTRAGIGPFNNACDRLDLPHTSNQVDWIFKCCDKAYLFYDPKQQVRASGLNRDSLERRLNQLEEAEIETEEFNLSTQMRVRGGDEYLDFVYDLLDNKTYMHAGMKFKNLFSSEPYDSRAGDPNSDTPPQIPVWNRQPI